MTFPPHLYVYSDTLIFPFSPVVSVLLVRLTVFPKRQYRGIRWPMTPVTTSPVWIPIVIWRRQSWTSVALVVNISVILQTISNALMQRPPEKGNGLSKEKGLKI